MPVKFEMVGGRTCLELVNTASGRKIGPFSDKLTSYEDLLDWGVQAEELSYEEAAHLKQKAAADPEGAASVLERARNLREAVYRVFEQRLNGEELRPEDLALISEENGRASMNRVLTPSTVGVCGYDWRTYDNLARPLWPAALSATTLIASEDATRVKACGNDGCHWLFLDTTKNRSRRWCDMKECGNREKARRHYNRKKEA